MSSRVVWPYLFALHVAQLATVPLRNLAEVRKKFYPKGDEDGTPVALRWVTTPELGFSREPFKVWRRAPAPIDMARMSRDGMVPISDAATTVSGTVIIPVAQSDLQYVVVALVTSPANASLTVTAIDASQRPIPGLTANETGSSIVQFRNPGIAALRVTGTGRVDRIWGIGETAYANLPDWQLIEVVGLPFMANELGAAYHTLPQGHVTPALDGPSAAVQRLTIAALLQADPPPTGVASFPLPPWPAPNPAAYVQTLRSPAPNVAAMAMMIGRCLQWAVDGDPNRMQVQYVDPLTISGIKQANLANASAGANSTVQVPVVGTAMLGVSTDSYGAVALGYGTTDIPPVRLSVPAPTPSPPPPINPPRIPPGGKPAAQETPATGTGAAVGATTFDYMVTAPFVLPPPLNSTLTLAALSAIAPAVEAPAGLSASVKRVDVPVSRNKGASAPIKLTWQASSNPQGYAILASQAPSSAVVLNARRASGGYDSYVAVEPLNPDPNTPPDQQLPSYVDTTATIPLRPPPATTDYMVAGLDVFGRWSIWKPASAMLSPGPVAKPRIRNVEFVMNPAAANGHVVPGILRIDFNWDWQDRAPGRIRLSGNFVPVNAILAATLPSGAPASAVATPPFLTGLAKAAAGPVGPPLVLTFHYADQSDADNVAHDALVPTIDTAHAASATVSILAPPTPPSAAGGVTQYRVELSGMSLDFTTVNERAFAVYATATEEVRPADWSDADNANQEGTGRVAHALDPTPPAMTFNPPAIQWTALPDATGVARGILQWTADPKAAGCYVWEATESALWKILSPTTPTPSPTDSMVARAANLSALIGANQDASLQAFARLNKDPIAGSRTEILLPGTARTLFVYRISATSAVNVEASRSTEVAYFAVPRRLTPGTPRLLVLDATATNPVQVIATPVESGVPPYGYRLFRVRSGDLKLDGHTMGPPKAGEADAGWTSYSYIPRNVDNPRTISGKALADGGAARSWYPYHYRVTAIGPTDVANGIYGGESDFSNARSAYALPLMPPQATVTSSSSTTTAIDAAFTMDLPLKPSPVGPALVEILANSPDPDHPGGVIAKPVLALSPDAIVQGLLTPSMPGPALRRSPATNEVWTLFTRVPAAPAGTYALRLTDPLGRQSLHSF